MIRITKLDFINYELGIYIFHLEVNISIMEWFFPPLGIYAVLFGFLINYLANALKSSLETYSTSDIDYFIHWFRK